MAQIAASDGSGPPRKTITARGRGSRGSTPAQLGAGLCEEAPLSPLPLPPTAPHVPQRKASLGGKAQIVAHGGSGDGSGGGGGDGEVPAPDPARKIWTDMRRAASGVKKKKPLSQPPSQPLPFPLPLPENRDPRVPPAAALRGPDIMMEPMATPTTGPGLVELKRRQIRDAALRNKRSIGADSLRSLVPSLIGLHLDGDDHENGDGDGDEGDEAGARGSEQRKYEGLWGLGGWW